MKVMASISHQSPILVFTTFPSSSIPLFLIPSPLSTKNHQKCGPQKIASRRKISIRLIKTSNQYYHFTCWKINEILLFAFLPRLILALISKGITKMISGSLEPQIWACKSFPIGKINLSFILLSLFIFCALSMNSKNFLPFHDDSTNSSR